MKVEMLREGEWIPLVPGWRLQSYGGGSFTLQGAYGGHVAPPWRVLDDQGNRLAVDEESLYTPDGSIYLAEPEHQNDPEGNARQALIGRRMRRTPHRPVAEL